MPRAKHKHTAITEPREIKPSNWQPSAIPISGRATKHEASTTIARLKFWRKLATSVTAFGAGGNSSYQQISDSPTDSLLYPLPAPSLPTPIDQHTPRKHKHEGQRANKRRRRYSSRHQLNFKRKPDSVRTNQPSKHSLRGNGRAFLLLQ